MHVQFPLVKRTLNLELLKEQKNILLEISFSTTVDGKKVNLSEKADRKILGLICLIDSIQDAVAETGVDENLVFDFN
jgi:hypothetical protein